MLILTKTLIVLYGLNSIVTGLRAFATTRRASHLLLVVGGCVSAAAVLIANAEVGRSVLILGLVLIAGLSLLNGFQTTREHPHWGAQFVRLGVTLTLIGLYAWVH